LTQEFPIFKVKEQLPKIKGILIPAIIIGKITDIKNKIILNDEEYFSFILSDESATISLAIKVTKETNERINFVKMNYDTGEKIAIKEPRKVNVSQLKNFNIDLLVSKVEPPIGTELLKYSEYKSLKRKHFKNDSNSNTTKKIVNKSYGDKVFQLSFTTASKILEENSNKIEKNELVHTPESLNQLLERFQIGDGEISDVTINSQINLNEKNEKSGAKVYYIITTESKTQDFCAKFTFLTNKKTSDRLVKLFEFKLKNEDKYNFLKENLSHFTTLNDIKQLEDNLGINK